MTKNKKGFTIAELLIVVAIIAVLVGISTVLFIGHLEKSREATDLANVRAKYAEIMALAQVDGVPAENTGITRTGTAGNYTYRATVDLEQKTTGWTTSLPITLSGITFNGTTNSHWVGTPAAGGKCTISFSSATGIIFNWSGLTGVAGSCWYCSNDNYVSYKAEGYQNGWNSSAVTEQISAKGGQILRYTNLTDNEILKAELDAGTVYTIGLFYLDPNDTGDNGMKVLFNSQEQILPTAANKYTISKSNIKSGQDVKVVIQFFKYSNGKTPKTQGVKPDPMSSEEINALASLFYVSDK